MFLKRMNWRILILGGIIFYSYSPIHPFDMKTKNAILEIGSGANLVLKKSLSNFSGKIVKNSNANISGESITFNDGILKEGDNENNLTGIFDTSDSSILLNGNKKFKAEKGKVLNSIKVSGHNNRLEGEPLLNLPIIIQDTNSSLTCAFAGKASNNIVLNGGTLYLDRDLLFIDDKLITGSGIVFCNDQRLAFGGTDLTWEGNIYFPQARDIELNAHLHLAATWTFEGASMLCGNGNILYLESGGSIVVRPESSLLLKNITIKNVSENKIRCLDDTGSLIFHDVRWIQDGNYSFTRGAFEVLGDLVFKGSYNFAYQTCKTSTIDAYSTLFLDTDFTFSYDPAIVSKELFEFEDASSVLYLNEATLHSTVTGLQLKKGTLVVEGTSYISSEKHTYHDDLIIDEGITFGNDLVADDFVCRILSGATLQVLQGSFVYRNMSGSSWKMIDRNSILFVGSNSGLKLYQTLNLGNGKAIFNGQSILLKALNKYLLGPTSLQGVVIKGALL